MDWSAVAKARYNRDNGGSKEPALGQLESYLIHGKNLTNFQKDSWAGDFPLTVLTAAMGKLAPYLGANSLMDLSKKYPNVPEKDKWDDIIHKIGMKTITFPIIREKNPEKEFVRTYFLKTAAESAPATSTAATDNVLTAESNQTQIPPDTTSSTINGGSQNTQTSGNQATAASSVATSTTPAHAISDPRTVKDLLNDFKPIGKNRQKVVTLRNEALALDIKRAPTAFCFLVRSMFEISAKAYCDDHKPNGGPSAFYSNGADKKMPELFEEIYNYMITLPSGKKDLTKRKVLHGAFSEIHKSESLLSITSMNALVHSSHFVITSDDACITFVKIFPLLEALNQ